MSVRYTYKINWDGSDRFTQLVQVGSRTLLFNFQWAIVSEEQYDIIRDYLRTEASSDPILRNGDFDREYDWYSYYIRLVGINLGDWLDTDPDLPQSIAGKPRSRQLSLLNMNIGAAQALTPAITLYEDIIKWQFTMTCDDLDTTVGYVQPGGWYHNQDNKMSFRFTSELEDINHDNISVVSIEFEVYDES